jgi:hypothetical protein
MHREYVLVAALKGAKKSNAAPLFFGRMGSSSSFDFGVGDLGVLESSGYLTFLDAISRQ